MKSYIIITKKFKSIVVVTSVVRLTVNVRSNRPLGRSGVKIRPSHRAKAVFSLANIFYGDMPETNHVTRVCT